MLVGKNLKFEPDVNGHLFSEQTVKEFNITSNTNAENIEIVQFVLIPHQIFTPAEFQIESIDDCAIKR